MSVTIYQSGRLGNCCFSTAFLLAYAKKHDLEYYIPQNADAYKDHSGHRRNPFGFIPSTGNPPFNKSFTEANIHTTPSYQDIPKMDKVVFNGYYQSFLYFDQYRDFILDQFKIPQYTPNDTISINYRRGDCINSPNFPIAPKLYYDNAIKHMNNLGFFKFKVFGDGQNWAKTKFTTENYLNSTFTFSEGQTELQDWYELTTFAGNITARSTFSLTAAWCNRNPNKTVCVPTTKFPWWKGLNKDLLTGTNFIQIDFEKIQDEWSY